MDISTDNDEGNKTEGINVLNGAYRSRPSEVRKFEELNKPRREEVHDELLDLIEATEKAQIQDINGNIVADSMVLIYEIFEYDGKIYKKRYSGGGWEQNIYDACPCYEEDVFCEAQVYMNVSECSDLEVEALEKFIFDGKLDLRCQVLGYKGKVYEKYNSEWKERIKYPEPLNYEVSVTKEPLEVEALENAYRRFIQRGRE